MLFFEIEQQFAQCKSWEERYRLLIQFSRKLPKPDEHTLTHWQEISGCESRLWFNFEANPRKACGYSDARLMQGILFILCTYLHSCSLVQLTDLNLTIFFERLKIAQHLTNTRLNGLLQIEKIVKLAYCTK